LVEIIRAFGAVNFLTKYSLVYDKVHLYDITGLNKLASSTGNQVIVSILNAAISFG
jgi:hypothetical protein